MAQRTGNNGSKPTHDEIARRAREIYERNGRIPGRDLENWLEAETQLMGARKADTEHKPATADPKTSSRTFSKPEQRT